MFVVAVTITLREGAAETFMPLMQANARASVETEPGCHQFDVCTAPDNPDLLFLYEVYDDRAAFDAHLASAHFKTFDAETAAMIADKTVQFWDL